MIHFVSKREATAHLRISNSTLKRYRADGKWIEGVHWVRLNSRCVRYNLELIQDRASTRHPSLSSQFAQQSTSQEIKSRLNIHRSRNERHINIETHCLRYWQ
jgi:hypothetical protein